MCVKCLIVALVTIRPLCKIQSETGKGKIKRQTNIYEQLL